MDVAVLWFRRDLRLSDHPALEAAARAADVVVPLFVVDPILWDAAGANRATFLLGCLRELDDAIGGHLVVRHGTPGTVVPELAREVGATGVWATEDFTPYGRRRDQRVAEALARHELALTVEGTPYAVAPGTVLTGQGAPYKVFTPFSRSWEPLSHDHPRRKPPVTWAAGITGRHWPEAPAVTADLPAPGEAGGRKRLATFGDRDLADYDRGRDRPGDDTTSRLSPYLRFGCLHPRQVLARLDRGRDDGSVGAKAAGRFRTELCWREFYADVLFHRPDSAWSTMDPSMTSMEVDEGAEADERFAAWVEGRTGYPLVDAGMRQLAAEGWMHNRVRMVTASFLVKDLHLTWQRGAALFAERLVDFDLASNNHGWQWVAGTGTDAAPYFRVFNPTAQAERFDPDAAYVKRWVPELRGLPDDEALQPWTADDGPPEGYPAPIVDHAAERQEALERLEATRRG